jgi:hypothetical protein
MAYDDYYQGEKLMRATSSCSQSLQERVVDEVYGRPGKSAPTQAPEKDCGELKHEEPIRHRDDKKIPQVETDQDRLAWFLDRGMVTGDKNQDGYLSRKEVKALASAGGENQAFSDFVLKNFDTISMLHTDSTFWEGGISRKDLRALWSSKEDATYSARSSYSGHYRDVGRETGTVVGFGAGLVAQAADYAFLGGTLTGSSILLHLGAGATYPLATTGRIDLEAIAVAPIAGAFWGPIYSTAGGYYGGQWLGGKVAQSRFDNVHAPKINSMFHAIDKGISR